MGKSIINKEEYSNNPDIWSAGGVVIRSNDNIPEVLICERFSENI